MNKRDNYTVDEVVMLFYSLWGHSVASRHLRIIFENTAGSLQYDTTSDYFNDCNVRPHIKNMQVTEITIALEGLYVYAKRFGE